MPIAQIGQVNVSALNVPQALIQIVPPQYLFNGVPTNIGGYVGTASWGPTNLSMTFGNYAQYSQIFGPTVDRYGDIGGHVILGGLQGAGYYAGVRVTDGTDVAATGAVLDAGVKASQTFTWVTLQPADGSSIVIAGTTVNFVTTPATGKVTIGLTLVATIVALKAFLDASTDANLVKCTYAISGAGLVLTATAKVAGIAGNSFTATASISPASNATAGGSGTFAGGAAPTTGMTITARYTGSFGNGLTFNVQAGLKPGSYNLVLTAPGFFPEVFTNVGYGLTNGALWASLVAAINNGNSTTRPGSQLFVATVGASTIAPAIGVTTVSGGTDGASGVTTANMLGVDALPRTGMYALRNQLTTQFTLCDLYDPTAWSTIVAFGLSEGSYAILATQPSDTLTNAQTELNNQGIDTFTESVIFGDWVLWRDNVNGNPTRKTSPAAIKMGLLGNLSPEQNTLNKPINGIVGTESSLLGRTYSYSDLQLLGLARLDLICLDPTLTNNFIFRQGINTSSNPVIKGDEYTRVTYFLAKSLQVIANHYVGMVITPKEMRQAKIAIDVFLGFAQENGIIGTFDNTQAYQTIIDTSNNSQATVALGYQYAYVKVIYQGILRYFIVDLEGGASVQISDTLTNLPPSIAA